MKFQIAPSKGETRLCLDPWAKVFVRATSEVCLCCNAPPVGSLKNNTLSEIFESDRTKEYRATLLEGKLLPACRSCPDREIVTTKELEQRVIQYLTIGRMGVY